jgi:hypothetical protein
LPFEWGRSLWHNACGQSSVKDAYLMLLQTNSYIVPRDRRMEHARLLRRFRQTLLRLGCDHFEVYEQVGTNWNTGETTGRFVQIMRFRDRKHQLAVQAAERTDPTAQALVREFCELINFPYQQQQGLFAVGFYTSFLRMPPQRTTTATAVETGQEQDHQEQDHSAGEPDVIPMPQENAGESAEFQEVLDDEPIEGESLENEEEEASLDGLIPAEEEGANGSGHESQHGSRFDTAPFAEEDEPHSPK